MTTFIFNADAGTFGESTGQTTFTMAELIRRERLAEIDDEICGLFGQDIRVIYELAESSRLGLERYLTRLLDHFRKYVADYDSEFDSWMWMALHRPGEDGSASAPDVVEREN